NNVRSLIFYFEIIKNNFHPQFFIYTMHHDLKLCFCIRLSNHILLLALSSYSISSQKHTISGSIPKVSHPNFPVSLKTLSTYFLWGIKIPCLEYATSIPRKYFSFPNSFISNCVANFSFRTRRRVSLSSGECIIKRYKPSCSLATPIILPVMLCGTELEILKELLPFMVKPHKPRDLLVEFRRARRRSSHTSQDYLPFNEPSGRFTVDLQEGGEGIGKGQRILLEDV
ncbi:hypothetical protein CR513_59638, partial [Mucuna pruriens]